MLNKVLIELYDRDLDMLKKEISSYKIEANLWVVAKSISNSSGNLCLHIIGNLNHFIGATLGNTGYVREREKEFSSINVNKNELISAIDNVSAVIKNTIEKLTPEDFSKIYPINVFKKEMTIEYFMIHLITHLNYHLGQINYHRRLIDQ